MFSSGSSWLQLQNSKTKKGTFGEFTVVRDVPNSILGAKSVQQMGLTEVKNNRISAVTPEEPIRTQPSMQDDL